NHKNSHVYVFIYFIDNSTVLLVWILMLLALQSGKKFGNKRRQRKTLQNSQVSFDWQCGKCLAMVNDGVYR
ncbi:MAG: hypothetical protein IJL84_03390, partial [Paludibacteraceae bacterium]|nr:hypothetical protein [Paludibacteraceae bacterium]